MAAPVDPTTASTASLLPSKAGPTPGILPQSEPAANLMLQPEASQPAAQDPGARQEALIEAKPQYTSTPSLAAHGIQMDISLPNMSSDHGRLYMDLLKPATDVDAGDFLTKMGMTLYDTTVGPGLASLGVKVTKDYIGFSADQLKQQWAENPIWINLLNLSSLLGVVAPIGLAARKGILKHEYLTNADEYYAKMLKGNNPEARTWTDLSKEQFDALDPEHKIDLIHSFEQSRKSYFTAQRVKDYVRSTTPGSNFQPDIPFTPSERVKLWFTKNFANSYYRITNDWSETGPFRTTLENRIERAVPKDIVQTFLEQVPGPERGKTFMQGLLAKTYPNDVPGPSDYRPGEEELLTRLVDFGRAAQQKRLESGFLAPEEHTGHPVHFNGMRVWGRGFLGDDPTLVTKQITYNPKSGKATAFGFAHLDQPNLITRESTPEEILDAIASGEIYHSPRDLVMNVLVRDEMIHQTFQTVVDIAGDKRYALPFDDIKELKKSNPSALDKIRKNYISLEEAPQKDRILRMMRTQGADILGDSQRLPWIHKQAFDALFGDAGLTRNTKFAHEYSLPEVWTMAMKTAATALNPRTQVTNLLSAVPFMSQHGVNPFNEENAAIGQQLWKAVNKIVEYHKANNGNSVALDELFHLGADAQLNLGTVTRRGQTFDLDAEILHPLVEKYLQEGTFMGAEAYNGLSNVEASAKAGSRTRAFASWLNGLKKSSYQVGSEKYNLGNLMDFASKTYLSGDVVPKLMSYIDLRSRGFSREAAVYEGGRRFPMYGTTGAAIKSGRKVMFPWLSFPVEALRITKNNLLDHPLRTMPWLFAPQIIQSTLAGLGLAPSGQGAEEWKKGLPTYYQNPSVVQAYGGSGVGALTALHGAGLGAITGAAVGGPAGGLAGAIAGGVSGYYLGSRSTDAVRGALVKFLPHTSFMLSSTSPLINPTLPKNSLIGSAMPFDVTGNPSSMIQSLLDQSPVKPLAVLMPFINLLKGEDVSGRPIRSSGNPIQDTLEYTLAMTVGNLTPPFIRDNLFRTRGGDSISMSEAMFGQHVPGDFTDISQFMQDMKIAPKGASRILDPYTLREKSPTMDFLLNHLSGILVSTPSSPEQRIRNETRAVHGFKEAANAVTRMYREAVTSHNDAKATALLAKRYQIAAAQNVNYAFGVVDDMHKWLNEQAEFMLSNPAFSGMSKNDLTKRIIEAVRYANGTVGTAQKAYLNMLRLKVEQNNFAHSRQGKMMNLMAKRNAITMLPPVYDPISLGTIDLGDGLTVDETLF